MKKHQKIELKIEKLVFGGKGLAQHEGRVIFVEGGIPGDRAEVRITRIKKKHIEARLVELLQPSPLRQDAPCSHFGVCGGCKWQSLAYPEQLKFKSEQVLESLQHLGKIEPDLLHPAIPSPLEFEYRNKMEFSFTDRRWLTALELKDPRQKKDFVLGLHVPGSFDRVMHIGKCWLQDEHMNRILNFCQEYFRASGLSVFNLKTHEGLLRFVVLRKSFVDGNYMVIVVTSRPAKKELREFSGLLQKQIPAVSSIYNSVNSRPAQIAFGEEEHLLVGSPVLREKIGGFEFEISPNSFFQTNPLQAEHLYRTATSYVGEGQNLVWDLYSGTGTIALFLSGAAKKVVGFELVRSAVKDAYRNCERNKVDNCEFIAGDIRKNISGQNEKPDVIVCDPPRSGMHPDVVREIAAINPARIVYVSCNPTTLARDLALLGDAYRLAEIQPVDMFPHTYHIESVARLERK